VFARLLAVTAIVGVTMLGNLRLHASEATKGDRRASLPRAELAWIGDADPYGRPSAPTMAPVVASVADADSADDQSDDVQLVPAIYAWNPDVRFVYFRHIRKWM